MASFVQLTNLNTTTAGTPAITLANSDTLFVGEDATVTATGSNSQAVQTGTGNLITLEGTLYSAANHTVISGGTLDLRIGEDGAIFGAFRGVHCSGGGNTLVNSGEINVNADGFAAFGNGNSVTNFGTIVAGNICVDFEGSGNQLINYGTIRGAKAGADAVFTSGGDNIIRNYGTLSGHTDDAIDIFALAGTTNEIYNSGLIERAGGSGDAIGIDGDGITTLVNTGTVIGNVSLGNGNDSVDTLQGRIQGTLSTGGGNDTVSGSNATGDRINGQAGDDVLDGNGGNDTLIGGAGADELNGGDGIDAASYSSALVGVTANLGNTAVNTGDATGDSYAAIENLIGSAFDDDLSGSSAANRISGGAGDDKLGGLDGNDYLDGGAGADVMTGGAGDDTFIFSDAGDSAIEAASGGNDIIRTSVNMSIGFGQSIERVVATGSFGVHVVGNEQNNIVIGSVGNDIFDGGAGVDTLRGAGGNDSYYVDNAGDSVIEQVGDGTDTVLALLSHTLGNNIEGLTLLTAADINGIGNSINNTITGNDGNNQLNGKGGLDSLTGNLGNDTFIFNAGQAAGDVITDFFGNAAAAADSLRFIGYGTVAQGATFVQLNATQWQINSFDNAIQEVINFSNSAAIHTSDFVFN
ncbi:MAG TPA: calcium-binding protein [Solimonas sp.]|nr:calcium-binding protein [Solimonas sp.]